MELNTPRSLLQVKKKKIFWCVFSNKNLSSVYDGAIHPVCVFFFFFYQINIYFFCILNK